MYVKGLSRRNSHLRAALHTETELLPLCPADGDDFDVAHSSYRKKRVLKARSYSRRHKTGLWCDNPLGYVFASDYYLRQGGYVFVGVCLFVSRIRQKLLNRFSQNSAEKRLMGLGKYD